MGPRSTPPPGLGSLAAVPERPGASSDTLDPIHRMPHPSRASRRSLLLGTAATIVGGVAALGSRRGDAIRTEADTEVDALAASAPLPIERGATVTAPAKRLRRVGGIMFPMGPEPRCDVLDNFDDARSGGRSHEGVDILATLGQEVYAVTDGVLVSQADASASLSGNAWGLLADDNGAYYFFAHLSRFAEGLTLGDRVQRGQVIGYVGDTGNPGPGNYHLHFEVHPGGQRAAAVDPLPLLEVPFECTIT